MRMHRFSTTESSSINGDKCSEFQKNIWELDPKQTLEEVIYKISYLLIKSRLIIRLYLTHLEAIVTSQKWSPWY
jgi:hypothetical protein